MRQHITTGTAKAEVCCILTCVETQCSVLQSRDCLCDLREQVNRSVYKESETIYLPHTENQRLSYQLKWFCLDTASDAICLRSKQQDIWRWEIWSDLNTANLPALESRTNWDRVQISEHAESVLWLVAQALWRSHKVALLTWQAAEGTGSWDIAFTISIWLHSEKLSTRDKSIHQWRRPEEWVLADLYAPSDFQRRL